MPRSVHATILLLSFVSTPGLASAQDPPIDGGSPPNIVFITSDDHRWDALGAAGNPAVHTPHIDRLAREGIHFNQATVNVSQCLPVRATLLTGLATHQHGAYAHQNQRPEAAQPSSFSDLPTVPSRLRHRGYDTVLVGKWHLASDPWQVGFSQTLTWLPTGAERFRSAELCYGESRKRRKVDGFVQEVFADDAIAFLDRRTDDAPPFMLWLAFTAPHVPLGPNPKRIEDLYRDVDAQDLLPPGFPRDIPTHDWRRYYEATSHLDEQIGRVLEALARNALSASTIVVFLGDNGFMMGERGIGVRGGAGKVVPYDGSVRVPMIVRAPGRQGFSGPSEAAISSLDLPPTFLAWAGIDPPNHWPGRSLVPALGRPDPEGFDDAYAEWVDDKSQPFGHLAFRMVRTPRHKLIVWQDTSRSAELYDLRDDPRERHNLIDQADVSTTLTSLSTRLHAWLVRVDDPAQDWPQLANLAPSAPEGPTALPSSKSD